MSSFLNNSWPQIPDGVPRFRIMRPRLVKSSNEGPTARKYVSEFSPADQDSDFRTKSTGSGSAPDNNALKTDNEASSSQSIQVVYVYTLLYLFLLKLRLMILDK